MLRPQMKLSYDDLLSFGYCFELFEIENVAVDSEPHYNSFLIELFMYDMYDGSKEDIIKQASCWAALF